MNAKIEVAEETYRLLIEVAQHSGLTCLNPEEVDIDEECACEKCYNCLTRQRLKATGLKEFEHMWR